MPVILATNKKILEKYQNGQYTPNDKWFNVAEVKDRKATIFIYDEISYFGVLAIDVAEQINGLDVDEIDLHINSPGGFVFDGIGIYNLFKMHKAKVNVKIDSLAASIASVFAMSGDSIEMAENAQMMIHNPMTLIMGDAEELRKEAQVLDNIKETLITTYKVHSSLERENLADLMDAETWFLADQAIEAGLAHATFEEEARAAALSPAIIEGFKNAPQDFVNLITRSDKSDTDLPGDSGNAKPNLGTPRLARAKYAYYKNQY